MVAPRHAFTLWWLLLLAVHGATAAFFVLHMLFYAQLEGTYLDSCLQFYEIGMATEAYAKISLTMGLIALAHVVMIIRMIGASLFYRSLAFTFRSQMLSRHAIKGVLCKNHRSGRKIIVSSTSTRHVVILSGPQVDISRQSRRVLPMPAIADEAHAGIFRKCYNFFDVKGTHFHVILFCREAVGTALQSVQAYEMSRYLPRIWLN